MSANLPRSPKREGFHPLTDPSFDRPSRDATIDIPLEHVSSHGQSGPGRNDTMYTHDDHDGHDPEKGGLLRRRGGKRKIYKIDSKGKPLGRTGYDGEEDTINKMGILYQKILKFSIVTRYFVYVLPLALLIAIPIVIGATAAKDAQIGGVRMLWLFTWIMIVWLSLWVSKIVAHWLPYIFQFLCGIVSSGTRKYALVIKALEIPLSLAGWAVTSLATFIPLMTRNPDTRAAAGKDPTAGNIKHWQGIVNRILAALLISSLIYLAEKFLIQLISINYHRKQFNARIKESKRNVQLLSLLYDASRALFPAYCSEFMEEDYTISDAINLPLHKRRNRISGSATPLRIIHDVGRFGDKITSAFGNVAQEVIGKPVFNPNSAHSVVVEALEKTRSSEALARRLWMSFVVEDREALHEEDLKEVLGEDRYAEAEECFAALDRDGNGDVSLDEMILTVTEIGRKRKSIARSMHDVDQAINVLDRLLATVVFVVCVFVFVAFLNASFTTTLATAGTALLSMSFVFAVTAQEVLGSCIFLFVKHPYDVGDRIDIKDDQFVVEHMSLLYTVFRRVNNNKMTQIPNIVLNTRDIENVSRSKAMKEQLLMYIHFDTTLEDIQALRDEMQAFVTAKENSRDFQPDVEVEVTGIAEMDKLQLRVEIKHKSNWANETVRAARRSKFMCALVLALRKIPIYGPGAGGAPAGAPANPNYSVAISDEEAAKKKKEFDAEKEAKRLFPSKKPEDEEEKKNNEHPTTPKKPPPDFLALGTNLGPPSEQKASYELNQRPPLAEPIGVFSAPREETTTDVLDRRTSQERQDIEEVRTMLRRQSTKGKRKAVSDMASPTVPTIVETPPATSYQPQGYLQAQGPAQAQGGQFHPGLQSGYQQQMQPPRGPPPGGQQQQQWRP